MHGAKARDTLTLRAEDGEALIARVHQSNLPRADAEAGGVGDPHVFFCGVGPAGDQTQCEAAAVLALWQAPHPAPSPEASSARSHADGDGPNASAVREADAEATARGITRRRGSRRGRSGRRPKADTVRGPGAWGP